MIDQDNDGLLASSGERMSRYLATRFSRRSLLGQLGTGAIVAATGGGAASAVLATRAEAHTWPYGCPCHDGCNNAATCNDVWGNNSCPSGTCECGWWTTCSASPCTYRKVWTDCCSTGSACDGGPRCHGAFSAECYYHKMYGCGCGSSSAHIKCRYWYCTSSGPCSSAC